MIACSDFKRFTCYRLQTLAIDLYLLLQIPRDSHPKTIEQAIRTAWTEGRVENKLLATAHKVLLDPAMRKEYDQRLATVQRNTVPVQTASPVAQSFQREASAFGIKSLSAVQPVNAYQVPQAVVDDVPQQGVVDGKLFTINGIGIATFFGTLIAGGILLAHNYRRLGDSKNAWLSILAGFFVTAMFTFIAYLLPDGMRIGLAVPQIIAITLYARLQQGAQIEAHQEAGGELVSSWLAAGIGLLTLAVLLVVIFVITFMMAMLGII